MSSKNSSDNLVTCLLALWLVPFMLIYSYLVNGWVLSMLWGWFIVTTFNMKPLSIVESIGLAMVVGFLSNRAVHKTTEDTRTSAQQIGDIVVNLIAPFIILFAGWVIYSIWFVR